MGRARCPCIAGRCILRVWCTSDRKLHDCGHYSTAMASTDRMQGSSVQGVSFAMCMQVVFCSDDCDEQHMDMQLPACLGLKAHEQQVIAAPQGAMTAVV